MTTSAASSRHWLPLEVEFAIDDFGTGQSSLSRLRGLPARRVKIDRSFIREIGSNDSAPILAPIIHLGTASDVSP
jgi:EAL domain-containing protein (putative c-di-GMP-specific phosphodiesterase class I)